MSSNQIGVKMSKITKLSFEEQIFHFEHKGVTFNLFTKEEALNYLKEKNSFFRLKSYCKNFDFNEKNDKYVNLDFAYLVDLSTLDMYLRRIMIDLSLLIEHYLKIELSSAINLDDSEDGLSIVGSFFESNTQIKNMLYTNKSSLGSGEILNKYIDNMAYWHLIELLTFGQFTSFYRFYFNSRGIRNKKIAYLNSVKSIRNASAHNVCLLNSIKKPYKVYKLDNGVLVENPLYKNSELTNYISSLGYNKETRQTMLGNPIIHDFLSSLLLFCNLCKEEKTKNHIKGKITELFQIRMLKNYEYYQKNRKIIDTYKFTNQVIESMFE